MIITRTPFRISFFGGGTDYPAYYNEHGGAVLNCAINKYCFITTRFLPPFFEYNYRIRYSNTELTKTVDEIEHPSVRECIKFLNIKEGIEIVHTSDIPAMSGIGSSSAFTVGLLHSLYALLGKMVTKRKLAFDAIHVEQNLIKENVGSQDQTIAAFGGFNKIRFINSNEITVEPIIVEENKLKYFQECLMFYFTGFTRTASEVCKEQIKEMPNNLNELKSMKEMVDEAIKILNGDIDSLNDFGKLLDESWKLKRKLSSLITTNEIDKIYEIARKSGAIGGKICGAGSGGFMLLFVPPENQARVKEALKKLLLVPIRIDNLGSHIAFYSA